MCLEKATKIVKYLETKPCKKKQARELGRFSVEERSLRGDMIEIFKISQCPMQKMEQTHFCGPKT